MLKGLVSILSRLPLRVHYAFADWFIYPMMMYVVRYRRRIVAKNLRLSFPDKSEAERRQLARDFYRQFSHTIVEIIYGYRMSNEEMRQRVIFPEMEEVNRLIDAAGGGIFMLAHFGNWEWYASVQQWVSPGVKELNVYRRLKSKAMDALMLDIRAQRDGECVEKQRILREMVRYRAEHQPVSIGLLSDQKPRPEVTRTWTTFLHQETGFLDGGEVLGKKFGYPVFYAYVRCPKPGYYTVQLKPIAADPKQTAEGEITKAYARALEQNIMEQPELWLWTHNRFKWQRSVTETANYSEQ